MDKKIDLMSRDYDEKAIKSDPRFDQCFKEMIGVQIFVVVLYALLLIVTYTVSSGDPANYTYVLGLPLWFILDIVVFAVAIAAAAIYTKRYIKDVDLSAGGE